MAKFEVGKSYRRNDCGFDPVLCTKRTEKTVWMKAHAGDEWAMRIRHDANGDEWAIDHQVPTSYRIMMAFQAKYPEQ